MIVSYSRKKVGGTDSPAGWPMPCANGVETMSRCPMFAGLMAVLCCLAPSAKAAEPVEPVVLKIGIPAAVFRDMPKTFQELAKKPFAEMIQKLTTLPGEVIVVPEASEIPKLLADGKIHIGVMQGHELAWAAPKHDGLQLIVTVQQFRSSPVQSYLFSRADSTVARYEDADGKTFALPKSIKDHTRLYLEKLQSRKACEFKSVETPIDSLDTLDLIVDRKADAGVVDSVTWETFKAISPARASKLKAIETSDVFPSGGIVCQSGALPKETLRKIHDGLLGAADHRAATFLLNTMKLKGFTDPGGDYAAKLEQFRENYPTPKGWHEGETPFKATSFQKK